MLSTALAYSTDAAGTHMGNIQLVQGPYLRMETHTGLDEQSTEYFGFVAQDTTSCAQAAASREPVTVPQVATAAVFSPQARDVILRAGSQACYGVPLLSPTRQLVGVMSTHHPEPLEALTAAQARALDETAHLLGAWLFWHSRVHVIDALEHLHRRATADGSVRRIHHPPRPGVN